MHDRDVDVEITGTLAVKKCESKANRKAPTQ